jgi:GH25 family lysozyme M1 (1,4-beta-N-acetylmuramidase)
MKAIDVSYWQRETNWSQVSGIDLVIPRTGYGLEKDSYYDYHTQGALALGLPVGAYHYALKNTVEGAREEARFVLDRIKAYPITWPVYYDLEEPELMNDTLTDRAVAFCEVIEAAGYKAGIYGSLSWIRAMDYSRISKYSIWCAQYDYDYCSYEHPIDMWQYSSKGSISGIPGNVDMNECYKDFRSGTATILPVDQNAAIAQADSTFPETLSTAELQRMLNLLNFGNLQVDDNFGPLTEAAVRTAQTGYGIKVDGIPGPVTYGKLCGQVAAVQTKLNELGYPVAIDGRLGRSGTETTNAVGQFQKDNGLIADQIIGAQTFALMFDVQPAAPAETPTVITDPVLPDGFDPHQQVTEHFNMFEFSCECVWEGGPGYCDGFPVQPHPMLILKLEEVRQEVNIPMGISSGIRCTQLNADVGGVPDSYHKLGRAADVPVYSANGISVSELAAIGRKHGLKTIEYQEQSFVHFQWND